MSRATRCGNGGYLCGNRARTWSPQFKMRREGEKAMEGLQ